VRPSGMRRRTRTIRPRGQASFIRQTTYLAGFGTEVASRAYLASPRVGVVGSGSVLDARIHKSENRVLLRRR